MTLIKQTNLSKKIIEHLKFKINKEDDYDSLVIAIYENELNKLADTINKDLSLMITEGIITEYKNYNGKRFIKLANNRNLI
ncbi:MAG: hypothetical protein KAQ90_01155 [Melioribacteraceae bacterium]|nr:hypothetical protein [Melioribacteraceae bacterium]